MSLSRAFRTDRCGVRAPAAERGDVPCALERARLADEAFHPAPVAQFYRPQTQGRRNFAEQGTERIRRHVIDFGADARAGIDSDEPGLRWVRPVERVEPIASGGGGQCMESRATRDQLVMK